jgi:DNA-binding transcriptional regulator YhcF (GntR family)
MSIPRIDPESPVPLYHQIAEAIRSRIASGELAPGEALVPLREAAERWGVNLHTVRHAYTALAREGLVAAEGARGTRVVRTPKPRTSPRAARAFVERVVTEARSRHGLDAATLVARIRDVVEADVARPIVHVVECSEWQCATHAQEIADRFDVEARPWSLERRGDPPPGTLVATYFHYNDVRRRWPARLREVRFVTIVPDPALGARVAGDVRRVRVLERDRATAENVAADLSATVGDARIRIEPVWPDDPRSALRRVGSTTLVLVAPRVWADLDDRDRDHPRVMEARYVIDPVELEALGADLAWPRAALASR